LEMENKLTAASGAPMTRYLHYLTDGTHITPKYTKNGIPFLSSIDVDPFLLPFLIDKFISEEEHNRLKHCQPDAGDILMSKSGRIGSCAVVPEHIRKGDWNIYEGIALLRITGIDPYYAVSFLNSKYGYLQM
jgi:type I restriction enzyme, S subunit